MSYTDGIGAAARWLKSCKPASRTRTVLGAAAMALWIAQPAGVQALTPQQQLALDVYRELIETNTVTATGDTARAAEAMAARLRTAGFSEADVQVFRPAPRK